MRDIDKSMDVKAWRERLCNRCVYFHHDPFTVGKCARRGETIPPSIVDERAKPKPQGCGSDAYWFSPASREERQRA